MFDSEPILTCYRGTNNDLISQVARMYLRPGDVVADVTYGKGAFWRGVDMEHFNIVSSDLKTGVDFRSLPYGDRSLDAVVLDPPYAHNPGSMMVDKTYNNAATTKGMYHKDIIALYMAGMVEANRVLKSGGMLWVKCQDEIESSKQCWSHVEILDIAKALGLEPVDLFVLHQANAPIVQHKNQKHARKNHSYLWVFQK